MNYRDKYLKYKNKYLQLKQQLGGGKEEIIQEMKDKGNYDEWVKLGSLFGTPSPTASIFYVDMNGEYVRVKYVKTMYNIGDVPVFKFKTNNDIPKVYTSIQPNINMHLGNEYNHGVIQENMKILSEKPIISNIPIIPSYSNIHLGNEYNPISIQENMKSEKPIISNIPIIPFNTDWANYSPHKFVKIYSNYKGLIRLHYIVNITVISDDDKYKIYLNLPKLSEYIEVFKLDSFCEIYGLFLGYESIENTGYQLDNNILSSLKLGNIITIIENTLDLGILVHKPEIVATGRINKINIENGKIISIQINNKVFKIPNELANYVIFDGEFKLDKTLFYGPILERKISVKKVVPTFNIDIEYGETIYKLSVNNEMTVKEVHYGINRVIKSDPTKKHIKFGLDINLITKYNHKNIIMDEGRTLSDYGFHEGSKIIVTPKLNTGYKIN